MTLMGTTAMPPAKLFSSHLLYFGLQFFYFGSRCSYAITTHVEPLARSPFCGKGRRKRRGGSGAVQHV